MPFISKLAKRESFYPSILLSGPSGSGKTYSALLMAQGFGGKIVLIDTESRRGVLYGNLFKYEYIDFEAPFSPERCREAIKAALALSPTTIIFDSATHEWAGKGGILREKDEMPGTNDYIKWGKLTPRHESFAGALTVKPKCFYIVTCRSREKNKVEEGKDKKMEIKRLGLQPVQRSDFRYDFTFAYAIHPDSHRAHITKSVETAPEPDGPISIAFGRELASWALMKTKAKSK
jgi:hypothetical protein